MIPLHEIRKLLGSADEGLSDADIEQIREQGYDLADALIGVWRRKKQKEAASKGEEAAEPVTGDESASEQTSETV
jgi:hypothetical protein